LDFSLMGVGTNILGYAHSEIDKAVKKTIKNGNMTTLNCPDEVYLAEKLIEMHPWSSMVRFARTGGEANSIALRIARAASGKDKVAICGYHGWHDWYLSTNLRSDKNLKDFLLPGLEPKGVPKSLKNSTYTFLYNRIDQLEKLIRDNSDIGVIFMEVSRNERPKNNFLQKVRKLASKNNIVLIFDECSSGFRENFGGLHLKYKVNPDIMMLGKALGNGYAITAVVGKKEIMKEAEKSFISSTFWTERIGPSAALKCLEIMEKEKSWEYITQYGQKVIKIWKKLAAKYNLKIIISGLPALASFTIVSDNVLYASISHDQKILNKYEEYLESIFSIISKCEKGDELIESYLNGPVCQTGFKRLN
jgi:glutamate-1-semialdehyde 2,1-aminomutase